MRLWLALFALLGLLTAPVAASAAPVCLHHAPSASMTADGPHASGEHGCCPDSGKSKPAKPDHKGCASACALMCAGLAALPATAPALVKPHDHQRFAALPPEEARAHRPSLPDRPPRHLA